jgi:hypothetical protein
MNLNNADSKYFRFGILISYRLAQGLDTGNIMKLGCGEDQLVVRRLAVRQARVRFSARHPMEVLLLLSEEAMRMQEDRPRRIVKDE